MAQLAFEAITNSGAPRNLVQLIYRTSHEDGERLVSDPRTGATGYTGARHAGLKLKSAADKAGKPIYLELSSVNPVVILPGALRERASQLVDEYATSSLMGTGQFCTNPGIVLLIESPEAESFLANVVAKYQAAAAGTLLGKSVQQSLLKGIEILTGAGARLLTGGQSVEGSRCAVQNTAIRVSVQRSQRSDHLSNGSLRQCLALRALQRTARTGASPHATRRELDGLHLQRYQGTDDESYQVLSTILVSKVGRLLNDKMPTGVAVSPAMNHGGPYPATGHPGFTAVGIPASMLRFAKLTSYDAVRETRLPWQLRNANATKETWRCINGNWSQGNV